ncbi:MAG: hypothetical protein ACLTSZ_09345 [Lachnospiraceae bacterium]
MDNERLSNVSIDQLHLDYRDKLFFRMEVPDSAKHIGGLTVFGRGFGNYNQDIEFRIQYSPLPNVYTRDEVVPVHGKTDMEALLV